MGAQNSLTMAVAIETGAANANVIQLNANLQGLTDAIIAGFKGASEAARKFGETTRTAGAHGVSSMQAASASIRLVEGGITNNIRAAERFVSMLPGVGTALKAAFPLVGLAASAGVLVEAVTHAEKAYEWFKKISDAAARTTTAARAVIDPIRVADDELSASTDRLFMQIAKLEHKPENGLKLALDEAILSADQLADSLRKDLTELQKMTQTNATSWYEKLFANHADVPGISDSAKSLTTAAGDITDSADDRLRGLKSQLRALRPNDRKGQANIDNQIASVNSDTRIKLEKLFGDAVKTTNTELERRQQLEETYLKYQSGDARLRLAAITHGQTGGNAPEWTQDQSTAIAQLKALARGEKAIGDLTSDKYDNAAAQHKLAGLEGGVKDNNALEMARKRSEDLLHAEELLAGLKQSDDAYASILERFNKEVFAATHRLNPQTGRLDAFTPDASTIPTLRTVMNGQIQEQSGKDLSRLGDMVESRDDKNATELLALQKQTADKNYQLTIENLGREEQAQLKSLDALNAKTVQQKMMVADQKYAIEAAYQDKLADMEIARATASAQAELNIYRQKKLEEGAIDEDAYSHYADAANEALRQQRDSLYTGADDKKGSARDTAIKTQTEVVQNQYKTVYDAILRQTDTFLGDIEDKTTGAWKRIADNFKKTFENVLNTFISSQFAHAMTGLLLPGMSASGYGKQGGFAMAGSGSAASSALGGLGGFFGGAPGGTPGTFAGPVMIASSPNWGDSGEPSAISDQYYAAGVSPAHAAIMASSGMSASTMAGGSAGHASGGGLMGSFGGLGKLFDKATWANGAWQGPLNSAIGMAGAGMFMKGAFSPQQARTAGGTVNTVGGGGMLGYGIGSKIPGVGGTEGAMIGLGGGMLINGSERGSIGGTLESTAGGAMSGAGLGMAFGGLPGAGIGALVGAGVGLISGLVGMFMGTALDHVKSVVKKAYGVSIDDSTAQSILNIANQSYGGSVSMAVSSPQVRQMMAMYAQATGQGNGQGIAQKMTSYSVADAGGSLYNMPSTVDGTAAGNYGGSIPTLGVGQMAGTTSIQLDGPATTALLSGQVAQGAPSAVLNGIQTQSNGQQFAASIFQPGLLTR